MHAVIVINALSDLIFRQMCGSSHSTTRTWSLYFAHHFSIYVM